MSNFSNQKSSLCPAYALTYFCLSYCLISYSNGRQTVGDGAFTFDNEPSVLAVCHLQGTDDMYYYSTTFSGGPGVRGRYPLYITFVSHDSHFAVALLTSPKRNALQIEGRWTV